MTYYNSSCPVETTLQLISSRWKVLILRDLLEGTRRFGELRDGLEEFEKVNILRARAAKNPKAKAAVARMDEELSKLFTVEKSRGNSHEEDVRKAREIIRKTTEISR